MNVIDFPKSLRAKVHASRVKDLVIVAWEMVDRGMARERVLGTLVEAECEARKLASCLEEDA